MKHCATAVLYLILGGTAVAQQRKGTQEIGVFAAGGPAITGGVRDRGVVFGGLRWGIHLTGNIQYGVEAIPLYLQFQSETVYGVGITPFLLRYSFTATRAIAPFIEAGGGILGTTDAVPEDTSRFNFTPQAGVGIRWFPEERRTWTFAVRYHHTSNAGLARRNPGINAVIGYLGFSWSR